jgi:beta-lactamase class A
VLVPAAYPPPRPAPPRISSPRPYEVSFGAIWGRVGAHTSHVVVRVGRTTRGRTRVHGHRFALSVSLPRRNVTVRVVSVGPGGRASTRIGPVFGLPRAASPRLARAHKKPSLQHRVLRITRRFPGTAASYVEDLTTGAGAAWNAGARFPAASTLKLAIAVTLMRRLRGPPRHGSFVDSTMTKMLGYSDNRAANTLLAEAGGAWSVDETLQILGLRNTLMYGGYLIGTRADTARIPVKTMDQPYFGAGKYTTAHDLARLLALVHLAAGSRGAIPKRLHDAVRTAEARYLLYKLAHAHDPGKLDRFLPSHRVAVLHKAGWIKQARHDAGLVYWPGGVFVAAVMTWNPSGAGVYSDVLAGRIARSTLTFLQRER